MICTGTGYDIDHCRVEKMGCPGCAHYKNNKEKDKPEKQEKKES